MNSEFRTTNFKSNKTDFYSQIAILSISIWPLFAQPRMLNAFSVCFEYNECDFANAYKLKPVARFC